MKHKRGEIIAKHLDEIFLDGYEDKILGRFKKITKRYESLVRNELYKNKSKEVK